MAKTKTIQKLNQGTLFRTRDSETSPVWVRGEYDKLSKTYCCWHYEDTNHTKQFGPKVTVFIDFTY